MSKVEDSTLKYDFYTEEHFEHITTDIIELIAFNDKV